MMQQYQRLKAQVPHGALMLFRLGDFYEMFFDDAKTGARVLGLTLTQRNGVPMCGLPYHAATPYISRLINAGHRVAVCDQMETPRPGQMVRREITQIISPGSVVELESLDSRRANYLASVCPADGRFGFAFLDTSTGDFRLTELPDARHLADELAKIAPAEIVIPDGWDPDAALANGRAPLSRHDGWAFQFDAAFASLREHFHTQSLDGFGCAEMPLAIGAAGGLLHYVRNTLRRSLAHVQALSVYNPTHFMILDETTRRALELTEPLRHGTPRETTLLGTLDRTCTGMGARRLRDWILHPLLQQDHIVARQSAIGRLAEDEFPLESLRARLGEIPDIERGTGRLSQGSGGGRDLLALAHGLGQIPAIREMLATPGAKLIDSIRDDLDTLEPVVSLIARAIDPACPPHLRDGGVIADGYDPPLDELRSLARDSKDWIARLQQQEQERTGIRSLKIRFNSVFGYFIEVSHANAASVPPDYHRKQTTANTERFVTPELKEMEARITGAEEKARALEADLFRKIRDEVLAHTSAIQQNADRIAALDALASLAHVARARDYRRPEILAEPCIEIGDGRHPVLEHLSLDERFVPNDTALSPSSRLIILTGPNMAGKSTYLRQVALLALMAHVGSFIPARSARIGLIDRIFTRVGASDDLSRGQSTFMVEMNETANILHNATERSLVVLDEIGRGTSTFDGLSIAWAVAEHLHDRIGALTLFATHYHETSRLARELRASKMMNVAVREWNDQVVFLRKIVEGATDKSYGIQVARLAGLPKEVLDRAKGLLRQLEEGQIAADALAETSAPAEARPKKRRKGARRNATGGQMDLFAD